MHPTALYCIVVSLSRIHAKLLLSLEAERCASAAAGSGSEARADAVGSRLQAVVRHGGGRWTWVPSHPSPMCPCSPSAHRLGASGGGTLFVIGGSERR